MVPLKFDIKLFLFLSVTFFISTIIGTVSHEFGHYALAKSLGYNVSVSYGYTYWNDLKTEPFIDSIYTKYNNEIELKTTFPQQEKFDKIQAKESKDDFLIILGGPFQTILTGTVGFFLMLKQKIKINKTNKITIYQWFCIFLTMFWLRQLANSVTWVIGYFINNKFSLNGDEVIIALDLNLPKGMIVFSTAIIAFLLLLFIIFKIITPLKRITFILAGLFGGILGYLFWLVWLGPIIMP
jgi:hypothetical protein